MLYVRGCHAFAAEFQCCLFFLFSTYQGPFPFENYFSPMDCCCYLVTTPSCLHLPLPPHGPSLLAESNSSSRGGGQEKKKSQSSSALHLNSNIARPLQTGTGIRTHLIQSL